MRVKWVDLFIDHLCQEGVPCRVIRRIHGWPETVLISGRSCFTKSITYNKSKAQYFQGVDPSKLDESGDLVSLCGGVNGRLRDIFLIPWYDFFKTIALGTPINTYKMPKVYYQYKFKLQPIGGEWNMVVQGGKKSSLDITPWHYSVGSAVAALK